mgnify:FL=1
MSRRDIPTLVKISRDNMAQIVRSAWGTEWRDDTLLQAITDPDGFTEITELNGEIAGYYTVFNNADSVFIISIQLRRRYQNKGLGATMMSRIEEWGRRHGLGTVELWVQSTNEAALGFYEHLGYTTLRRQGNNYFMRKPLRPDLRGGGSHDRASS